MPRGELRRRWRYERAARRAFARVTFYREQCADAGRLLAEPVPTAVSALPDPPHTLCPFTRPWSADREPSLWTPSPGPLARVLRMAGCREPAPVLEVREALLDTTRLPRLRPLRPRPAYRVLLSPTAIVASEDRRAQLNREALAVAEAAGTAWVVASPPELTALPEAASAMLHPVHRVPVAAVADHASSDVPTVLHEPRLGYLGARSPACGEFHLDVGRVYARERDGALSLSFPRSRRPTLLDMLPPGAETVTLAPCPRHGTPVVRPRSAG
jgi:hypothetical protein